MMTVSVSDSKVTGGQTQVELNVGDIDCVPIPSLHSALYWTFAVLFGFPDLQFQNPVP